MLRFNLMITWNTDSNQWEIEDRSDSNYAPDYPMMSSCDSTKDVGEEITRALDFRVQKEHESLRKLLGGLPDCPKSPTFADNENAKKCVKGNPEDWPAPNRRKKVS